MIGVDLDAEDVELNSVDLDAAIGVDLGAEDVERDLGAAISVDLGAEDVDLDGVAGPGMWKAH